MTGFAATTGFAAATGAFASGFAAATFATGVSTAFGATLTATFGSVAALGAAAFEGAALTAVGFAVVAFAGVFAVLLGITLLFFEDASVDIAIDGFGIAILPGKVLAAGLLAAVLPVTNFFAAFAATTIFAAGRAGLVECLSREDGLSLRDAFSLREVLP